MWPKDHSVVFVGLEGLEEDQKKVEKKVYFKYDLLSF